MAKKPNTAKPPASIAPKTSPAADLWQYVPPKPGMVVSNTVDANQVVLTFRPPSPSVIGRPIEAEQAIAAKAKDLPAVARWQHPRHEIQRLQELVRTARQSLADAERHYEDAAGDADVLTLAYLVDAARQQLADEQQVLARFAPIARKAFDVARSELQKLVTEETNKLQAEARAEYDRVAAEVLPQIAELVTKLAKAKSNQLVSMRLMLPGLANELIGDAPAVAQPADLPQPISMGAPVSIGPSRAVAPPRSNRGEHLNPAMG